MTDMLIHFHAVGERTCLTFTAGRAAAGWLAWSELMVGRWEQPNHARGESR